MAVSYFLPPVPMTPLSDRPNETVNPEVQANPEVVAATEKKTKQRGRGWLIALIIVVVIVLGIGTTVAALGVWTVPVLSGVLGTDEPIDLGVVSSPEALASLEQNVPLEISGQEVASVDQMFSGEVAVDTQMTSEEITSFLQRFAGNNPVVSNVQVKMIEGGLEISGNLHEYVHAPAYVKVLVDQTGPNSVNLTLVDAKLGRISIPGQYRDKVEAAAEDLINRRMAEVPGFSMDTLEYHDGYSDFVGTLPAQSFSNERGWSALLVD